MPKDIEARQHVILNLISHFLEQNEQIEEFTNFKERVNNNSEKIYVLRGLLGLPQDPNYTPHGNPTYNPKESLISFADPSQSEEELEGEIEELLKQSQTLDTEIKVFITRNSVIDREVKRTVESMTSTESQDSIIESLNKRLVELTNEVNK